LIFSNSRPPRLAVEKPPIDADEPRTRVGGRLLATLWLMIADERSSSSNTVAAVNDQSMTSAMFGSVWNQIRLSARDFACLEDRKWCVTAVVFAKYPVDKALSLFM
jgi:hypothetical protein